MHTSLLHRPAATSRENVHAVFPPAAYSATNSRATAPSREAGRAGLRNAPIGSLSASSWTMVPGAGLAEPVSETLLGGGVEGKAARKGRSMLRLFWRRSVVWEG